MAERLFKEMMEKYNVKPSCATFSILIKLYTKYSDHGSALTLVGRMKKKYEIEPELRIFTQLVQSCIRDRQGKRVLEAYELMLEQLQPPATVNGTLLSMCVNSNMFDTAERFVDLVLRLSNNPQRALGVREV